jgi:hypothetical protein
MFGILFVSLCRGPEVGDRHPVSDYVVQISRGQELFEEINFLRQRLAFGEMSGRTISTQ